MKCGIFYILYYYGYGKIYPRLEMKFVFIIILRFLRQKWKWGKKSMILLTNLYANEEKNLNMKKATKRWNIICIQRLPFVGCQILAISAAALLYFDCNCTLIVDESVACEVFNFQLFCSAGIFWGGAYPLADIRRKIAAY